MKCVGTAVGERDGICIDETARSRFFNRFHADAFDGFEPFFQRAVESFVDGDFISRPAVQIAVVDAMVGENAFLVIRFSGRVFMRRDRSNNKYNALCAVVLFLRERTGRIRDEVVDRFDEFSAVHGFVEIIPGGFPAFIRLGTAPGKGKICAAVHNLIRQVCYSRGRTADAGYIIAVNRDVLLSEQVESPCAERPRKPILVNEIFGGSRLFGDICIVDICDFALCSGTGNGGAGLFISPHEIRGEIATELNHIGAAARLEFKREAFLF